MKLNISNSKEEINLADEIFAKDFNESLVHQIVTAYMAASRAGTKAQKTRAEVSGGGAKPWKQKGTGRARAGTIRSPIWRSGGVTFAAKPRSYKQKVNKKMFKGALRSIYSELIRQDRLVIVDAFDVDQPKTKALLAKLGEKSVSNNTLIISDAISENLYLASRNLACVFVSDPITATADPVILISSEKIIVTQAAIKEIEDLLK